MKFYSDLPSHRLAQVVADVLVVLWIASWIWIGHAVHDATLHLAEPGLRTASAATSLAGGLGDAGAYLNDVPLVGDGISSPFDRAAEASNSLASAGRSEVAAVQDLARWLGISIALIPILIVVSRVVPGRWRFARDAAAGQRFIDAEADLDLFALRALNNQPIHVLGRISDDPLGDLRRNDRRVITELASLEMRSVGLSPATVRKA